MNSDETEDNDFSISSDKKQEGKEDIVFILNVQNVKKFCPFYIQIIT